MSSQLEYVEYIYGQLSNLKNITYRKMFGEYVFYYNGKIFGGIYDNRFLIKVTNSGRALVPNCKEEEPYKGAKLMFLISEVEDKDFLANLITTTCDELPEPKSNRKTGELSKLPNIGPEVERLLNEVGITTIQKLKDCGSQDAWLKIKSVDDSACIHKLYALEGALQGIKKSELSQETKTRLKMFYNSVK